MTVSVQAVREIPNQYSDTEKLQRYQTLLQIRSSSSPIAHTATNKPVRFS